MAAAHQENQNRAAAPSPREHDSQTAWRSSHNSNSNNHNRTQEEALRFMQEQFASSMAPPPERATAVAAATTTNSNHHPNFSTVDYVDKALLNSTGSVNSKFWDELVFPTNSAASAAAAVATPQYTTTIDPNRLSDQELLERFPSVGSLGPSMMMGPGWPLSRNTSSSTSQPQYNGTTTTMNTDLHQHYAWRSNESNLFSSAAWAPQLMSQHTDDNVVYNPDVLFRTTSLSSENNDDGATNHNMPSALAIPTVTTATVPPLDSEPPVYVAAPPVAVPPPLAPVAVPPPPLPSKMPLKKRRRSSHGNLDYIPDSITDHDVLLGRGGRTNHHKGNEHYLKLKTEMQQRYKAAAKEDKTNISQELVDQIHQRGGRFLKLDSSTDRWYVVPAHCARKKASQTLRELNTPEVRAAKRAKYSKSSSSNSPSKTHPEELQSDQGSSGYGGSATEV